MAVPQASIPLTLLLGVLLALTALGMDMFLPAVPVLARALGADAGLAQQTVTTYLLGLALGQFGWGPVSDRFGRRPVLLAGLALFLASSAAVPFAGSMQSVVWLRFVQGVGASAGPVVARSIVRDLYAREQAAHLLARMTAVFGIVPLTAPLIGGQAVALGGWTALFWVYVGMAVLLLVAVGLGLSETAPAARPSIAPARIAANYAQLLADPRFRAPLATMLLGQMAIISFVSGSAVAVTRALELGPTGFSLMFSGVMLGQITGGLVGSRIVRRMGIARMVRFGVGLSACAGLCLAALAFAGIAHWAAVVLPMAAFLFGTSFVVPNATAAALSPYPQIAGAASSLLGSLPFALGAMVSASLAAAYDGSMRPMAASVAVFAVAAFLAEKFLFRKINQG